MMRDWSILVCPFLLAAACGGDPAAPAGGDDDDPTGGATAGDDDDDDGDPGDGGGDPGDDDDDADPGDAAPDWSGTWKVTIDYAYTCDIGFGSLESNSGTGSWSLVFSGPPASLEVRVDGNSWYTMTGAGDEEGLFLCGSFPLPDLGDDAAPSGNDNQLCIEADDVVGPEEVEGVLTGRFQDSFGGDCEMDPSPLVLTQ